MSARRDPPPEESSLGEVMYEVAASEDVKNDQKVTMFRNGSIYTVALFDASDRMRPKHARADMDQVTAIKLYLRIVRAFLTGRYSWEVRAGWVTAVKNQKETERKTGT